MVRAIFKDCVLATAGSTEHTLEELKSWTEQRKGSFSEVMDASITHLLCTDDQFKNRKKNERIKEAERRGRAVRIVHIDWFTFSCTNNKKLPISHYNFAALKDKEQAKLKKQREEEEQIRNKMIGQTWINPDLYHIFTDKHHFRYEIQLFRTTENEDGAIHDKYELYLFESNAKPYLYWFGVKLYQKTDDGIWRSRGIDRPTPVPTPFMLQYKEFMKFFQVKTRYHWFDRVIKAGTGEKVNFSYTPPTRGKPVGGNLTKGLNYDECVRRNTQLHIAWAELFGDELPANIQVELAAKEILEGVIDKVCESMEDAGLRDSSSADAASPASTDMVQGEHLVMSANVGSNQGDDCEMVMDSDAVVDSCGQKDMDISMGEDVASNSQEMMLQDRERETWME